VAVDEAMGKLDGKVAIVMGAAGGIGAEQARSLAAAYPGSLRLVSDDTR
jgi:NAD(P)-dependent dehydrogenase (short-subunit alcohol dehydrogenase family)